MPTKHTWEDVVSSTLELGVSENNVALVGQESQYGWAQPALKPDLCKKGN